MEYRNGCCIASSFFLPREMLCTTVHRGSGIVFLVVFLLLPRDIFAEVLFSSPLFSNAAHKCIHVFTRCISFSSSPIRIADSYWFSWYRPYENTVSLCRHDLMNGMPSFGSEGRWNFVWKVLLFIRHGLFQFHLIFYKTYLDKLYFKDKSRVVWSRRFFPLVRNSQSCFRLRNSIEIRRPLLSKLSNRLGAPLSVMCNEKE